MKRYNDMLVGDVIMSYVNGIGKITEKKDMVITVTFKSGVVIKKRYGYDTEPFYYYDF